MSQLLIVLIAYRVLPPTLSCLKSFSQNDAESNPERDITSLIGKDSFLPHLPHHSASFLYLIPFWIEMAQVLEQKYGDYFETRGGLDENEEALSAVSHSISQNLRTRLFAISKSR
jgi:hypothetical protein